jgi:hypothetical protein
VQAKPNDGGLWSAGTPEGIAGTTSFTLGAKGLERIAIEWTSSFAAMGDCVKPWTAVRATYDGRFGASQTENGAAFWKTATAAIELACNPTDAGVFTLSASFTPPEAE